LLELNAAPQSTHQSTLFVVREIVPSVLPEDRTDPTEVSDHLFIQLFDGRSLNIGHATRMRQKPLGHIVDGHCEIDLGGTRFVLLFRRDGAGL
jgi:hypothetical protein